AGGRTLGLFSSQRNAGLLAVRILAAGDAALTDKMVQFQHYLADSARRKGEAVRSKTVRA
ncbi:hypothetical protein EFN04_09155, partial [Propionibacterium freudenreichii]|nr:hypothetical protein [Propionibacterium freudenreichii]